jgi:hypothetical protein
MADRNLNNEYGSDPSDVSKKHLRLRGRGVSQARKEHEAGNIQTHGSSTSKMEAIYASETVVDFHRSRRRCVAEDGIIHEQNPSSF